MISTCFKLAIGLILLVQSTISTQKILYFISWKSGTLEASKIISYDFKSKLPLVIGEYGDSKHIMELKTTISPNLGYLYLSGYDRDKHSGFVDKYNQTSFLLRVYMDSLCEYIVPNVNNETSNDQGNSIFCLVRGRENMTVVKIDLESKEEQVINTIDLKGKCTRFRYYTVDGNSGNAIIYCDKEYTIFTLNLHKGKFETNAKLFGLKALQYSFKSKFFYGIKGNSYKENEFILIKDITLGDEEKIIEKLQNYFYDGTGANDHTTHCMMGDEFWYKAKIGLSFGYESVHFDGTPYEQISYRQAFMSRFLQCTEF